MAWLASAHSQRVLLRLVLLTIIIVVGVNDHNTTVVAVSVVPVTFASPVIIRLQRHTGLPLFPLRCAVILGSEPLALLRGSAAAYVADSSCLAHAGPRGGLYEIDFRGGSGGSAALAHRRCRLPAVMCTRRLLARALAGRALSLRSPCRVFRFVVAVSD
jgi:hypothetical protein